MWQRLVQVSLHPHIQHRRIRGFAVAILLVRLIEGTACWTILSYFFSEITVPAWAVHLNFTAYAIANFGLFFAHRRQLMTPGLICLDLAVNLIPMAAAANWSGGIYSPLLPVFVIKIGSYGVIYGVDVGLQSLMGSGMAAMALALIDWAGYAPSDAIERVPLVIRQRLQLAFAGLIFCIGADGFFRFFGVLQDRETRLAEAVREKDQLYQESLQHQRDLRRLSRRMMQVSEATMRRVARELHDDLGQALTAVKMELGLIELSAESPVRPHLRAAREQIGNLLQSVRNLSQLLRPAVLDDLGVVPAMQSYISRFGERTRILVKLDTPPPETRLPGPLEVALYRVLQEALTNVARHANARTVTVCLSVRPDVVSLQIVDDGRGFDPVTVLQRAPSDHGMGVIGMRERVATYGGQFTIESRPGGGTRVDLAIPLSVEVVEGAEEEYGEDSRLVG